MKRHPYKDILAIALPAMAENLLQMLMGMVDSYLVAFLGIAALSGVAVANNILAVYQAVFIALAAAISSRLAQEIGQKNGESIEKVVQDGLKLTFLVGLIFGLLSAFFSTSLLDLLGTEAAVLRSGGLYLSLVGSMIVLLGIMTSLGAMLRANGRAQFPMYVSLLTNLLNAIFSAFAIFILDAGVAGAAIGTILSRAIGSFLLWQRLDMPLGRWTWHMDGKLLSLAMPAAGERLMMRLGDVVVVSLIVGLGTTAVAGNAIGETLIQFSFMPALGLATATVILTAQSIQESGQAWRQAKRGFGLSVVLMSLIASQVWIWGPRLIALYTDDSAVSEAARLVLAYSAFGVPVTAATLVLTAFWQGLGNARLPFYATTLGIWLVRISVAYVLIHWLGFGLEAIWIGTIADNSFRAGFLYFLYRKKIRRNV